MRVGTDGVLLGAWASLPPEGRILDVGSGSGLIALMSAQRSPRARIYGIEIDASSACQARENVQASPFSERVEIVEGDIRSFVPPFRFDAVVCNPPFYVEDTLSPDSSRSVARNASFLPIRDLLSCIGNLLLPQGQASFVVPFSLREEMLRQAHLLAFHLVRQCEVRTVAGKLPKRILLTLSLSSLQTPQYESLILQNPDGSRTAEFQSLCQDFYLH